MDPVEDIFLAGQSQGFSGEVALTSLLQPPAPLLPPLRAELMPQLPSPAMEFALNLLGGSAVDAGLSPVQLALPAREAAATVGGNESLGRVTSDAGNLLFKSPDAVGTGVQRRNPIINDPRIRGSRVGSLAASGSYRIPARIDLVTALGGLLKHYCRQAA